jgi:hypothetical protein
VDFTVSPAGRTIWLLNNLEVYKIEIWQRDNIVIKFLSTQKKEVA